MSDLLDTTLRLAKNASIPVTDICRATGVTPRWYYMLLSGQIQDPSVRRIQRLHDFLAQHAPRPLPAACGTVEPQGDRAGERRRMADRRDEQEPLPDTFEDRREGERREGPRRFEDKGAA